jgi:hypothetical protein
MPYPFLSPEWIDAVREVRDRYAGRVPAASNPVRMNQIVTDVPFGEPTVSTYVDTSAGALILEVGALADPEVTITTDYATARQLFVQFDQAAAMQAFMSGKIKVQGDMMKLVGLQATIPADGTAKQIAAEIQQLTA